MNLAADSEYTYTNFFLSDMVMIVACRRIEVDQDGDGEVMIRMENICYDWHPRCGTQKQLQLI